MAPGFVGALAACLLLALTTANAQVVAPSIVPGGAAVTTPLHGSGPGIAVKFQIYDGRAWQDADSADAAPGILSTGNVRYRALVENTGSVDLTSITVFSTGFDRSYALLRRRATETVELSRTAWSAGLIKRTVSVSAKHRRTTVSRSDDAYYFGLAPSMSIQLQVRDDNGVWRNSDSVSGSPILGQEFAQQRRNNSVQLRLQLNNTGNVELKNLALGGNWRGGASTGTIRSLSVGRSVNVDFNTPYQLMTPQNRNATVLVRISDRSRTETLELSNAVFWRATRLLATFLDIDSNPLPDEEAFVAADTNTSALRIPLQYLEDVRFRATAMNTGNTALYVRLNAGSGATKAETVQPGQNITLRFSRNYECGADLGDVLAASLTASTTYNGLTVTNTNPAFFTFFANFAPRK